MAKAAPWETVILALSADFDEVAAGGLGIGVFDDGAAVDDFCDPIDSHAGSATNVALDARDLQDVILGFFIGRHFRAVLVHGARARVIGGQGELLVVVLPVEELAEVRDAGADVFGWIEGIDDAKLLRRRGHQLHQPHRAFWRDRPRVEGRLHLDHRADEVGANTALACVLPDQGLVGGV